MKVVVIADEAFPQAQIVEMLTTCPWEDVGWVVKDSDRTSKEALKAAGLEFTEQPLDPWWKREVPVAGPPTLVTHKETKLKDGSVVLTKLKKPREVPLKPHVVYDMRSLGREFVFMNTADHILVFRTQSDANKHWVGRPTPHAKISIIEKEKRRANSAGNRGGK